MGRRRNREGVRRSSSEGRDGQGSEKETRGAVAVRSQEVGLGW
jgi:hypothetical protein